jgi:hypothetical protein
MLASPDDRHQRSNAEHHETNAHHHGGYKDNRNV